jgi:hypothetical protein
VLCRAALVVLVLSCLAPAAPAAAASAARMPLVTCEAVIPGIYTRHAISTEDARLRVRGVTRACAQGVLVTESPRALIRSFNAYVANTVPDPTVRAIGGPDSMARFWLCVARAGLKVGAGPPCQFSR